MCQRWRTDFVAFLSDMGTRAPDHTLDRIDNDGPYAPENCRWITRQEQTHNNRRTVLVTMDGETKPACEWIDERGISRRAVYHRLRRGWPPERALNEPIRRR